MSVYARCSTSVSSQCKRPFALGYDLELVKEEPSVFLGDSVEPTSHLGLFGREKATKCEYVAPVISHAHRHFNLATI